MKLKNKFIQFFKLISLTCICFIIFTLPAYAGPGGYQGDGKIPGSGGGYYYDDLNEKDLDDVNMDNTGALGKIANIIIKLFLAVGVILLMYSVGLFVMSFRNDNPEERHKATVMFVVAVIFLGMRTLAIEMVDKTFEAAGYGNFIK